MALLSPSSEVDNDESGASSTRVRMTGVSLGQSFSASGGMLALWTRTGPMTQSKPSATTRPPTCSRRTSGGASCSTRSTHHLSSASEYFMPQRPIAAPPSLALAALAQSPAFVPAERVDQHAQVLGMPFLGGEDLLEPAPRRRVAITQVLDHLAVGVDGDPLRHQVLADHVDQAFALDVLRMAPRQETVGIHVGRSAELHDPLGDGITV